MKQLIFITLQGLFSAICDRIDNSFGNNMSVDAVCVLISMLVINWIIAEVYHLGLNAYNVLLSKAKECLLFCSFVCGRLCYIL